jgi:hypothetical protein
MRPNGAQRRAHQQLLVKKQPAAETVSFRIGVEKHIGEKWVLCARAPSHEAAERHAKSCGGTHRVKYRGTERILVYDPIEDRLLSS